MIGKAASPRQAIIGGGIGGVLGFATGYITRALTYKAPVVIAKAPAPVSITVWTHDRVVVVGEERYDIPAHWAERHEYRVSKPSWHVGFEGIPPELGIGTNDYSSPICMVEDNAYSLNPERHPPHTWIASILQNDTGTRCDVYLNGTLVWENMEAYWEEGRNKFSIKTRDIDKVTGEIYM